MAVRWGLRTSYIDPSRVPLITSRPRRRPEPAWAVPYASPFPRVHPRWVAPHRTPLASPVRACHTHRYPSAAVIERNIMSSAHSDAIAAVAARLAGRGAAMSAKNAAAAAPTAGLVPAAADDVSALPAAQFAIHAQMYQEVSAQVAAMHDRLVSTLLDIAHRDAATEAGDASAAD
jgi:PE family